MAHDVFVCYSSEDKTIANAACAKLESAGIRCWIAPRDPIAGIPYGRQLVEAITAARVVLLIFSGNANRSEHVLRELEVASDSGKIIVPFRIENVTPSGDLRYYITRVHWLDAMSPPMETRMNELVALMQRLLEMPLMPAPAIKARSGARKPLPLAAALLVAGALVAIAVAMYLARRPAGAPVNVAAKPSSTATTKPKVMNTRHKAPPSHATTAPVAANMVAPPTPRTIYVAAPPVVTVAAPPPPAATSKFRAKATARPTPRAQLHVTTAAVAPTVAPTIAPVAATRAPKWLRYQLPTGHIVVVTYSSGVDWRLGGFCCYHSVGRTDLNGTAGTNLVSINGRVWMFVPDLGAGGPYAHEVCFSNAGPGQCDANRIFPILDTN